MKIEPTRKTIYMFSSHEEPIEQVRDWDLFFGITFQIYNTNEFTRYSLYWKKINIDFYRYI